MSVQKPIRKSGALITSVLNQTSRVTGILAIAFLLATMVLTVADVFLRYVFNNPISGSVELCQYFMVVAGFGGIAWCAVKRGHLKVDFLVKYLPTRFQTLADIITLVLGLTVVPIAAWQGFVQARATQVTGDVSDLLKIPDYPFYAIVGLGYALLFLVLITILIELIKRAFKK